MPAQINQVMPNTRQRHDDIAERIIMTEGLAFSLASFAGNGGDLREARGYLKEAICRALASEFAQGSEFQRRTMDDNAIMDRIEKDMARETPHAS